MADYKLQIDWNNNGTWTDTGEDVSARLLSLEWARGRDFASQLTGRSISGRLRATLNNESEDYSPFNTASPLYGNLLPGRPVRIRASSGSFPYTFPIMFERTIWQGFLLAAPMPAPSVRGLRTASLEAIGPLGYINDQDVNVPMVTSIGAGAVIDDILDAAGWPAGSRDIDAGQTTIARFWGNGKAVNLLRKVELTEAGFVLETKAGLIAFEDRHHRLSGDYLVSQATFSDAPGASISYHEASHKDPLAQLYNEFRATVQLYTVGVLGVLWTLAETGAASPAIETGDDATYWANYPNLDSALDAFAVDSWTTPVATTDYTANSQADGLGTNMTADIGVVATKLGNSMKITLTNNGAQPAYITFLQARGVPITANDPIRVSRSNAASRTAYGQRTYPSEAEFIPDSAEANGWARFNLAIYKDPVPIAKLRFRADTSSYLLEQALEREIGDRITVVAENEAGLGINEDFFIEAERHQVAAGGRHTVEYDISSAERFSDWWVLDTSILDASTRLAY